MNRFEEVLKNMNLEFFGQGKHKISPEGLFEKDNAVLLDVRTDEEVETIEFRLKHHVKSLNIPTDEIPDRLDEIPRDKFIGVFCSSGVRASIVYAFLHAHGFSDVRILVGGYEEIMGSLKPGKLWKRVQKI